jgi:TPR repeat protein
MLVTGQGLGKDLTEAVKWTRKAAEQGHPGAQYNLANFYDEGVGLPKDALEATRWYRRAAEQGEVHAQYNLALQYEDVEPAGSGQRDELGAEGAELCRRKIVSPACRRWRPDRKGLSESQLQGLRLSH